jgi:hypothetical protein
MEITFVVRGNKLAIVLACASVRQGSGTAKDSAVVVLVLTAVNQVLLSGHWQRFRCLASTFHKLRHLRDIPGCK